MAQYKFEGDFENITETQLDFINKVVQEQNLDVDRVVFLPVGKPGDNFGSNVKRISIEGKKGIMRMIVKIAPTDEVQRQMSLTEILFKNEHFMYMKVLPKFLSLQRHTLDLQTPEEDMLRFARCYGSFTEAPNEVIILEDLCESKHVMLDKFQPLTSECMQSVLKSLAAFHTLSYALKQQEPETFAYYKSELVDVWGLMAHNPEFKTHTETFIGVIQAILDGDDNKKVVKDKLSDIVQLIIKLAKWEQNNKHSVILQGDAWTNNIMFKIWDDKVQTIMIDFQGSANSNPMVDVLYAIFNCSDRNTRARHYYVWLDYYYLELDKSLSNFGLKSNYIYPRDQMDADMKRYGKLIFGMSVMLANILMRDTNEASELMEAMNTTTDMNELMESMGNQTLNHETILRVRSKIEELIDCFTHYGLI
ncbi:unnamed protein product [Spodoptera littoralis]|uniref:CHK kinase-like domain-containing protein n=1 Tax=Spodoptera littoralis TaxID=7109 RepID=A0A9P0HWI7_SPOLI|nr:unnamed protein product [Spodoptera littoralis]CAH1634844.1 unnamed protein product [Spodoptera littoralis]